MFMWPWPLILYLQMTIGLPDILEIFFKQNQAKHWLGEGRELLYYFLEGSTQGKRKHIELSIVNKVNDRNSVSSYVRGIDNPEKEFWKVNCPGATQFAVT